MWILPFSITVCFAQSSSQSPKSGKKVLSVNELLFTSRYTKMYRYNAKSEEWDYDHPEDMITIFYFYEPHLLSVEVEKPYSKTIYRVINSMSLFYRSPMRVYKLVDSKTSKSVTMYENFTKGEEKVILDFGIDSKTGKRTANSYIKR